MESAQHGWEEYLDEATGATFYYNPTTQVTQWERPSSSHEDAFFSQAHDQIHIGDRRSQGKQDRNTLIPISDGQYQQPQHHIDQSLEAAGPKRTKVTIKSKKQLNVLKNTNILKGSSKIYAQEEPLPPMLPTSSSKTRTKIKIKTKSKTLPSSTDDSATAFSSPPDSDDNATSSMPVGGKSQDYLGMVQIYNLQRPFLNRHHTINCVLCQQVVPEDIFFPCEHKVVCRGCLQKEQVCPDYDMDKFPNGHCNCPLCAAVIKLILPNEYGKEVEKYWEWVLAVKPELPQGFKRDFRHSAAIIQKVHIDENKRLRERKKNVCCVIS